MKIRSVVFSLVLATSTASAWSAHAGHTTIAGATCHAYQGLNESLLIHSFLGCINVGSSSVPVVLPLIRVNQDVGQSLYLDYQGTTSQGIQCNAYLYPYDGGPAIWGESHAGGCNSAGTFEYTVPGDAWGYLTVYCDLPPDCRIIGSSLRPG